MRRWRIPTVLTLCLLAAGGMLMACGGSTAAPPISPPGPVVVTSGTGPATRWDCPLNISTDAFTGAFATASEIGWEGNQQGVVTCLGGTFLVQDGMYRDYGFGIYNGSSTTWVDEDGYLPAQVTTFHRTGATISITEFADRVVLDGRAYVAVYSRVTVVNPTGNVLAENPEPSSGMVALSTAPDDVGPHATESHDYVVAADRFGHGYPWPTARELTDAGSFDQHFEDMRNFWDRQLAGIAEVTVPDAALDDAYRAGFIYTQIARSGNEIHTGVNGYQAEYSHDVIGILSTLFTQGYFSGAHTLLLEARKVVGEQGQYQDGLWTYPWLWAVYLLKSGDLSFVRTNFDPSGPGSTSQPGIEEAAHAIAADRTGPSGIMESTDDIDFNGYWTTDDYDALLGLAAYRYVAMRLGQTDQEAWASEQYDSLLSATSRTLDSTITRFGLHYLPCSMLEPNTANTCSDPRDANWASPIGRWAWDGSLFGAALSGPGLSLIDATYAHGFRQLGGILPADTFGGFPDDYYSSAYNAGYGFAGLASQSYRDQGILSYQFMIANSQSGPYSWWESSSAPSTDTPWIGKHPAAGQGASPHAWGMSQANAELLDSVLAQSSAGSLIVGRGIPERWLVRGSSLSVSNFPTVDGQRLGLTINSTGRSVSLTLRGHRPAGSVLVQLPTLIDNIASTSTGVIDEKTGTVTLSRQTASVTIHLRRAA